MIWKEELKVGVHTAIGANQQKDDRWDAASKTKNLYSCCGLVENDDSPVSIQSEQASSPVRKGSETNAIRFEFLPFVYVTKSSFQFRLI